MEQERCRLAHFLGHLSATEKGEQLYSHMSAHCAFFSLVEEFSASYASGKKVQRPCVVGFSMLALTNLLKQEMHRAATSPPPPSMPTADYLLAGVPQEPKRLLCLWSLLKGLSGGERSRSSLRTLAHSLELLSVLQLAHMATHAAHHATSLLEHCREPSLHHAKLQVHDLYTLLFWGGNILTDRWSHHGPCRMYACLTCRFSVRLCVCVLGGQGGVPGAAALRAGGRGEQWGQGTGAAAGHTGHGTLPEGRRGMEAIHQCGGRGGARTCATLPRCVR